MNVEFFVVNILCLKGLVSIAASYLQVMLHNRVLTLPEIRFPICKIRIKEQVQKKEQGENSPACLLGT